MPSQRQSRLKNPAVLILALIAIGFGIAGFWLWRQQSAQIAYTPTCSWPMRAHGNPEQPQIGLVRCYLQDLASRNASGLAGLIAVTEPSGGRITRQDLVHAHDASSGLASASFQQNGADSENATVTITFADGATWETDLYDMVAFDPQGTFNFSDQGPDEWRMAIGSDWDQPVGQQQGGPASLSPTAPRR